MNEPIFNSVHHLHRHYTIAIRQEWLTPGVSNCMVFNFKGTMSCALQNQIRHIESISEYGVLVRHTVFSFKEEKGSFLK